MMIKLPKRLNKAPLVEVVFEMRFQTEVLASNILSGIFFTKNKSVKIEKLPVSDIPQQLRDFDPVLRYAPQLRMIFENYAFLIGDRVFAIANSPLYMGWTNFKEKILEIVDIVKQSSIVSEVERYSLKYVNLIEAISVKEQLKCIKLNLRLGSHQIEGEAVNIKVEVPKNNFISIVQIISNGVVNEKEGVIINIDSIANGPHSNYWSTLPDNLQQAHDITKELFFDFLREETIEKLEPMYDK